VYARVIQRPPIAEDGADRDFGDVSECHSPLPCLANHSARRISLRSSTARFELGLDLSPRLRAPARVEHHPKDAIDAEPGVPEAEVVSLHFVFAPRGSTESLIVGTRSCAPMSKCRLIGSADMSYRLLHGSGCSSTAHSTAD
jgi:hypothetical protein